MRRTGKLVMLMLAAAVAGGCGGTERVAGPEGPATDLAPAPEGEATEATQDGPPSDTTGRYGGSLGSGG